MRIEDAATGELRHALAVGEGGRGQFSPDGTLLAVATAAQSVEIVSVVSGEKLYDIPVTAPVFAFSHHSGWLALGTDDGIQLFDLASRKVRGVVPSSKGLSNLSR